MYGGFLLLETLQTFTFPIDTLGVLTHCIAETSTTRDQGLFKSLFEIYVLHQVHFAWPIRFEAHWAIRASGLHRVRTRVLPYTGLPCLTLHFHYILHAKQGPPCPFDYLIIWKQHGGRYRYWPILAWAYPFGMIVHACKCDKTLVQAWNRHAWMMSCYNWLCTQNLEIMKKTIIKN